MISIDFGDKQPKPIDFDDRAAKRQLQAKTGLTLDEVVWYYANGNYMI
jgi:hypothetical protein